MGTCQCDDPYSRAPKKPAMTFGAIAHSFGGDRNSSKSTHSETSKAATDLALSHCRSNSRAPDRCRVVTWYVNSCGALAVGDKAFAAVGGGNNAPDLSLQQAQEAALAACRKSPGNGNCKVEYSGCSDELTPEEVAENEAKKRAVVKAMGNALCALWPNVPGCVGRNVPAERAKVDAENARMAKLIADAQGGNANAQHKVGFAYHKGQGVKQDYAQAADWYRKAAAQGYAPSQVNLGAMCQTGQGVKQDYALAVDWYGKAAAQGDADAQANLGMLYHQGLGVKLDYAQAAAWYKKAAAQGHADAQRKLELLYNQGHAATK